MSIPGVRKCRFLSRTAVTVIPEIPCDIRNIRHKHRRGWTRLGNINRERGWRERTDVYAWQMINAAVARPIVPRIFYCVRENVRRHAGLPCEIKRYPAWLLPAARWETKTLNEREDQDVCARVTYSVFVDGDRDEDDDDDDDDAATGRSTATRGEERASATRIIVIRFLRG